MRSSFLTTTITIIILALTSIIMSGCNWVKFMWQMREKVLFQLLIFKTI